MDELIRRRLAQLNDPREVVADPDARDSGAKVNEQTLVPSMGARLGETSFETVRLRRPVALKFLSGALAHDPAALVSHTFS